MDRDRPLPAALRLPHPEQPAREVDVVPVEPEQLAPAQAAVGHQREQQPVALGPCRGSAAPRCRARPGCGEQPLELAHRQHVRQHLALLRRPQRQRRVAQQPLLLDEEAEEALQRRRRPRLARGRRPACSCSLGEEGAQVRHLHLGELDPLTLQVTQTRRNVTLVRRASHRGKPPLHLQKRRKSASSLLACFFIDPPSGSLPAPAGASSGVLRLTGLLRKKPWQRGFFYGPSSRRDRERLLPSSSSSSARAARPASRLRRPRGPTRARR